MKLGDFLDHLNDLIQDNELAYIAVKEPPSQGIKRHTTSKTLVRGSGGNPASSGRFCHLGETNGHHTRAHTFEAHGEMTVTQVKDKCRKHVLCYHCGSPSNVSDSGNPKIVGKTDYIFVQPHFEDTENCMILTPLIKIFGTPILMNKVNCNFIFDHWSESLQINLNSLNMHLVSWKITGTISYS